MTLIQVNGTSQYVETHGDPARPPVLLVSGLGGTGASWAGQVPLFAERYFVIVPDQRGTGRSSRVGFGHTTAQLAADLDVMLEALDVAAVHVVGSSTGGAIAQHLALDHPARVLSLTLSSSFARFDPYLRREFEVRRRMAAEWDRRSLMSAYALFLFSTRYTQAHPDAVEAWIERAAAAAGDPDDVAVALRRIDMIAAHDTLDRLAQIARPTLVLTGTHNVCTTPENSRALAAGIPGAHLVTFEGAGELVEIEMRAEFFAVVSRFIDGPGAACVSPGRSEPGRTR